MSQHFTFGKLLRYTAPAIGTMIFTSIYGVVDGFFVSNFAGKTAFAAVNFIMPIIMILGAVGFMVGTGGNAIVSKSRGKGDGELANRQFSLLIYFTIVVGIILAILGSFIMRPIASAMGATGEMLDLSTIYARINMISLPMFMLQMAFQSFCATAGKPKLGFYVSIAAGVTNIVLDFILVGIFHQGVIGAAAATVASEFIGGGIPLIYFSMNNDSFLHLGRTNLKWKTIGSTCWNGSSEVMANVALNLVGTAYNMQLMRLFGPDGVSAYGVIMYVGLLFGALFIGYSVGAAPLMAFQYGAQNHLEMRSLLKKSLVICGVGGIAMFAAAEILAPVVASIFTSYDADLYKLTLFAFRCYVSAFVLVGFSIYGSSLFTSLCNGKISALIAFLRTLVFEMGAVFLLPVIFGADAIWFSVTVAEIISTTLVFGFLCKLGPRYHLLSEKKKA